MRIISQDKKVDIPYESFVIEMELFGDYDIRVNYANGGSCTLGTYSSKEKALKVMEMLRNKASECSKFTIVEYDGFGRAKHKEQIIYFQLPQDDEVEV